MIYLVLFSLLLQPAPLYVVSPDFTNGGSIPARFTCDGEDTYPTLIINGIPTGTKSLLIIAEDPDQPSGSSSGWMAWNVPPVETIMEDTFKNSEKSNSERVASITYRGPCPVAQSQQRFSFKVFALNSFLTIDPDRERSGLLEELKGLILAKGELTGFYSRSPALAEKE